LSDEDLRQLELLIGKSPEAGKLIPGAHGLRKIRFAAESSGRGKRGGIRVGYAFFRFADAIYLIAAFSKNERADFSAAERNATKALLQRLEKQLRGM
jgi:hypothetical protein